MPIPTTPVADNFRDAALRHLDDGDALRAAGRFDGAVYHAGYAAECAVKWALGKREPLLDPRSYAHDLARLGAVEVLYWMVFLDAQPDSLRGMNRKGALTYGHPGRRYWPTCWNRADADEALRDAEDIVRASLLRSILDDGLACPE